MQMLFNIENVNITENLSNSKYYLIFLNVRKQQSTNCFLNWTWHITAKNIQLSNLPKED